MRFPVIIPSDPWERLKGDAGELFPFTTDWAHTVFLLRPRFALARFCPSKPFEETEAGKALDTKSTMRTLPPSM